MKQVKSRHTSQISPTDQHKHTGAVSSHMRIQLWVVVTSCEPHCCFEDKQTEKENEHEKDQEKDKEVKRESKRESNQEREQQTEKELTKDKETEKLRKRTGQRHIYICTYISVNI